MLKLAAMAVLLCAAAGSAQAYDSRSEATEVRVAMRHVDFDNRSEVAALHYRLQRAAVVACDSNNPSVMRIAASDRACATASLDRAVAKLNKPQLTAFHEHRDVTAPGVKLAAR